MSSTTANEVVTRKEGRRPNIALWVTSDHQIYQKEVSYPTCGPDQCIVHVVATGICGSEIHFWKTGRIGDCCVTHDLILGHESAGRVLEVGSNVTDFKPGDRVAIEPGVACLDCKQCLNGRYNLCPKVAFSGTPPSHGTMLRYVAHPAKFLFKIPDKMSFRVAALIEPLSVAMGAIHRAVPKLGTPVMIAGAGPIGLSAALIARAAGCYPIAITDLEQNRLDQAAAMGFENGVKVEFTSTRHDIAKAVREVLGTEPPLCLECTGAPESIAGCIYAVEDGGTICQIGCGKPDVTLPLMSMSFREINLMTSFRYMHTWPIMIKLLSDQVIKDAEGLITHTYKLEEATDAFECCVTREKKSIKVQIVDDEEIEYQ